MANERNVVALYELLQLASVRRNDPGEQIVNRELARFLASRGVLVPSALTDEEAVAVNCAADEPTDPSFNADFTKPVAGATRAALERIAKGETHG